MDRDSLRLLLEQGMSLQEIGRRFGRDPTTVGYWVRKHGLRAVHADRHRSRGGLDRQRVETLIADGRPVSAIAEEFGITDTTVLYWLRKWGLRTRRGEQRARAQCAKDEARATTRLVCKHHGLTEFRIEGRGCYRCLRCRGEAVARRRRRLKETLVEEAGGGCRLCGYGRSVAALQFHHLDRGAKRFALGGRGLTRSLAELRREAEKCVLLCANCHAEVEAGIVKLEGAVVS
jgi:transposase-like protein